MVVGIGQGALGDPATKARMVQLRPHGPQTRFDPHFGGPEMAQAYAEGEIENSHSPLQHLTTTALAQTLEELNRTPVFPDYFLL
jgi:hypothetical protein